jgi:putative phosphoesterase
MRILVVSDIHGNWPALAAIDEPHDVCLCLGDLVDYGPDSARCVRWAMEHAHYAIRGNHDHGVAQGIDVVGESGYRYLTRVSRPSVWDALGADERRYLLQLPLTRRLTLEGKRFLMVHATPRDPLDEYLMKDPVAWARRVQKSDADIVLVGHSHMQFNLDVDGVVVVNPGSVGQPRDGDPRAAYAVIEGGKIELKRVTYPIEETVAQVEASLLPERAKALLINNFRFGRLPGAPRLSRPDGTGAGDGNEAEDVDSDVELVEEVSDVELLEEAVDVPDGVIPGDVVEGAG